MTTPTSPDPSAFQSYSFGHDTPMPHATASTGDVMSQQSEKQPTTVSLRLLLVEDDPDQRELISEMLEDHFGVGCVDYAATCRQADEVELPGPYALVLCDVNLPDGSGLDVLKRIRMRAPCLPVMMLTGENDSTIAREAIKRGACDYAVKAGAYLDTMPLTVEKNLAADAEASVARQQHEAEAVRLQDENKHLTQTLSATEIARKEAEREASLDAMTGCYNRRAFERIGDQLFSEAYRTGGELSLVMIDLDKFKQVNDTLGHAVGDDLIRCAAKSIQANLRAMDVACRYGGDEFILLLPKTSTTQATAVASRIADDFGTASMQLLGTGERKTMSLGVAELHATDPEPANVEALMVACDRALYRAKEGGRAQVCAAA